MYEARYRSSISRLSQDCVSWYNRVELNVYLQARLARRLTGKPMRILDCNSDEENVLLSWRSLCLE